VTLPASRSHDGPALALSKISKHFGTVTALDDVSFSVRAGTVHALVGENGAGKTTLMRIAFGLIAADSGTITAAETGRRITSAADAIDAGMGMVHQHFTNVPAMIVAENVALGGRGRLSMGDASRRVTDIGVRSGLVLDPIAPAADLPVGGQQRLEIVKALARNTRMLILDEPTAVLAPAEAIELLRWLRQLADDGNSAVLITHKLDEALRIADDVTVLRRGRVVLHAAASGVTADGLANAMLGEDSSAALSARIDAEPAATVGRSDRPVGRVVVTATGIDVLDDRELVADDQEPRTMNETQSVQRHAISKAVGLHDFLEFCPIFVNRLFEGHQRGELILGLGTKSRPGSVLVNLPHPIDDSQRTVVRLKVVPGTKRRPFTIENRIRSAFRPLFNFDCGNGDVRRTIVGLIFRPRNRRVLYWHCCRVCLNLHLKGKRRVRLF